MDRVRKISAIDIIKEVEKHPIIYDFKYTPPCDQLTSDKKKKTWEIIAENLHGKRWQIAGEVERENIAKEIQFKWKNVKDNFMKTLRKEKEDEDNGILVSKKKKYIYYDLLSFLRPFVFSPRKTSEDMELGGKNASNIIYINETKEQPEGDANFQSSPQIAPKPIKVQTPITPMPTFGTLQPVQLIQLQPNTLPQTTKEPTDESATRKLTEVLENMLQAQAEERSDDSMGNKKFLMSLLPFMRKLPDDVNLEVRLQLMSVLLSYGGKDLIVG
ncbi:uncharacterized protein [Diabrotica undecimpunctata]|uniref:uncharacterized protein isoform X1 n=2 Tax=Diabrotica undecimpunctata TaxID=50387 RepID=UPI003B6342C0